MVQALSPKANQDSMIVPVRWVSGRSTRLALTNLFTILAYLIPILGGVNADTKWGPFKTICVGKAIGAFAHVLLLIPAIPAVIKHPNGSLAGVVISIIVLAFAAGFIKPSLGPLGAIKVL